MRRIRFSLIPSLLIVLVSLGHGQAAIVADSVAEFSGSQGQDNWYYGFYSGSFLPSSFSLMTIYNPVTRPNNWVVNDDLVYTSLASDGGHPNGSFGTRDPVVHYAVRRWVVEATGDYTITGQIADLDAGPGENGIIGRIFNNNTELYNQIIAGGDFSGVNYLLNLNLTAGTNLDFVIDPNGQNDLFDSTKFTATISHQESSTAVPEPSSLLLLLSGVSLTFFRRRIDR